jgi:DNA invertase Pin-like site-specific DNA recombinase
MNGADKIRPEHRERRAFVYARQSSAAQLLHHRTSTERQFDLANRAVELGWPSNRVEVIADDLGRSGRFTENRQGFQRLAAEMGLGRVGVVLSLDASRLARSSADWHRLLEIAVLTRTLLADEQTVYDPRDPNDRLVLGMKGTMADFELEWLRHRMHAGLWHRARRGEKPMRPPIGYVNDECGRLQLDPDEEIRRVVKLLFERYRVAGSMGDVVRYFNEHDIRFPGRFTARVTWQPLTRSRLHQVVCNPLYTGAYVFGRTRRETVFVDGQRRTRLRVLPQSEWPVVLKEAHPAFITWDEFMANQKRLSDAGPRRQTGGPGAPREGAALLQGLLRCARCGHPLQVAYLGQSGRYPQYHCQRLVYDGRAKDLCVAISSRFVDGPIVELVLRALTPENLDAATSVVAIIEQQDAALEQQWRLRLERARYEAKRAERQYDACDPENRVVARTLEMRWNEKLVDLEKLEHEFQEARRQKRVEINDVDRQRIMKLADDLPRLWQAKTTTDRDRKLLLRILIKEVSVRPVDVPSAVRLRLLWHTGAIWEIEAERAPKRRAGHVNWRLLSNGTQDELPEAVS